MSNANKREHLEEMLKSNPTGEDLLKFLQDLTPEQRKYPLVVPGHFGEYYEMGLPYIRDVRASWTSSLTFPAIAFCKVDVGPAPD